MKPTRSVLVPRSEARFTTLPPGLRVKDQADACRSAGLAFMWCARASWGKRELAQWLVGPYAAATKTTTRRAAISTRPPPRSIPVDTVHALLARSHAHVVAILRACTTWQNDEGFARRMVEGDVVVGVMDVESGIGYAPVAAPGMRLVERVVSLFVADFLTRPSDYARFRVCHACSSILFDGGAEHRDVCTKPAPFSGPRFVASMGTAGHVRGRRSTLIGLGERAA